MRPRGWWIVAVSSALWGCATTTRVVVREETLSISGTPRGARLLELPDGAVPFILGDDPGPAPLAPEAVRQSPVQLARPSGPGPGAAVGLAIGVPVLGTLASMATMVAAARLVSGPERYTVTWTVVSVTGIGLLGASWLVGPSSGHFAAGLWRRAIIHILLRTGTAALTSLAVNDVMRTMGVGEGGNGALWILGALSAIVFVVDIPVEWARTYVNVREARERAVAGSR